MKSAEIIYKYGHFYDLQTGKRLLLKDGESAVLVYNSSMSLLIEDPLNKELKARSSREIEQSLEVLPHFQWHAKLLSAGDHLQFTINSQILTSDDQEKLKITFRTTLLEDLYYYKTTARSLASCHCVVDQVIWGNLPYFEPIYASSLNEAHSRTFVHYFSKYGQGTAQASNKFRLRNEKKLATLMTKN